MDVPLQFFLVFLCGMAAGWLYFGGLMLTIRRARSAGSPGMLFLASFVIRAALTLALFLAVSRGQGARYAMCILGFLGARGVAILLWSPRRLPGREVKAWRS